MTESTVLTVRDHRSAAAPEPMPAPVPVHADAAAAYLSMIERAVMSPAFDAAKLEKLLALRAQEEERAARNAFTAAMARFKANAPRIEKNKRVHFRTRDGDTIDYRHATHDEVTSKIVAGLGAVGISHAWDVEQRDNEIVVTCTLTHELGHSPKPVSMSSGPDTSGKKNPVQQIASAVTYLQRYTLLSATGLSTGEAAEDDDDGRSAGGTEPAEKPAIPEDVSVALRDAAARGWNELGAQWRSLTGPTCDLIREHHSRWWEDLKAHARNVDAEKARAAKADKV